MASTFNIQGPTSLSIQSATAGYNVLGYTDNEDLISVDIQHTLDPYTSTETGSEPAALIYTGVIATISATLIKWDTAQKDTLLGTMWEVTNGAPGMGVYGQNIFDSTNFGNVENLGVKITPTATANIETYAYTFDTCWLDAIQETGWGNAPKRLVVTFKTKPNGSGRLFTRALIRRS